MKVVYGADRQTPRPLAGFRIPARKRGDWQPPPTGSESALIGGWLERPLEPRVVGSRAAAREKGVNNPVVQSASRPYARAPLVGGRRNRRGAPTPDGFYFPYTRRTFKKGDG